MTERVERVDDRDRVLGVVDRAEAIRRRWLHRVATVVCRDGAGRVLVHRRPEASGRFPGHYNWLIGGAVSVGESYAAAAARELSEELGVHAHPRFIGKFRCAGALAPYWLAIHETVIATTISPDPIEIAWHDWISEPQLETALREWRFVPDSVEAFDRYAALTLDR